MRISEILLSGSRVTKSEQRSRMWLHESPTVRRAMEIITVFALSGLAISNYLPFIRISTFSKLSLTVLMIWKFVVEYVPVKPIPRSVIIFSLLYFVNLFISALFSQYKYYEYFEYNAFKYFMIGGLLYTVPLHEKYRKFIIVILLISATLNGVAGIMQYYGIMPLGNDDRPHGFSVLPTFYAAQLAFAAGVVIILLANGKNSTFNSKGSLTFLLAVALLTSGGIILSGSRGTWIAFAGASLITLFLYNRRSTIILTLMLSIIMTLTLFFDSGLRFRTVSTIALPVTDMQNSQGNRFELWKGALFVLRDFPFIGVGSGDFQIHIHRLITEKKLKEMKTTIHAHNIFFQTLATQGIVGFIILSTLLVSLIRWGLREMNTHDNTGGYMIFYCALLVIFSGMTDYYFGSDKYWSTCYVIIGLFGSYGGNDTTDVKDSRSQLVLF